MTRGNPAEKQFHDCIGAYAPVDNVVPGAKYPTILVTAGLHDPRVGYWEPAKVKKRRFFPPILFFPHFFSLRVFFASTTNCTLYISTKQQKTNFSGSLASASWPAPRTRHLQVRSGSRALLQVREV